MATRRPGRRSGARQRLQNLAGILICGLSLASWAGCAKENQYVEPPPPEVTVTQPIQRDIVEYIESTATTEPALVIEIRARVRGFLKECLVREGANVQAGELLLVIDEGPFRVQLEQAKAKLAEAKTAVEKAKHSQAREITRAQLALDESQAHVAITEEERMRPLIASRAVAQESMDRAEANRKKSEAQVAATKANLVQIDADYETNIAAAEANVAVAESAVRSAEIDLGYCRIAAPISGRIGRIRHDVGNLVGDSQATLLTTVVQFDPIHVYTTLSVEDFLKFRKAASETTSDPARNPPVELALSSESGFDQRGEIDYYDPTVDKGTGTIEMRGVFPNPQGTILPGVFTRIRIPIANRPNALLVPEQSLGIDQSGQFLLVVGADDKVDYRPVRVGRVEQGMRVVEGKISTTDRVIVEGLLRARPGIKVVPHLEQVTGIAHKPEATSDDSTKTAGRGAANHAPN